MNDLDQQIRRLAGEIQAVEQVLVEVCGVPPVTAAATGELSLQWAYRLRSLCRRAYCSLGRLFETGDLLAVRAPQPD